MKKFIIVCTLATYAMPAWSHSKWFSDWEQHPSVVSRDVLLSTGWLATLALAIFAVYLSFFLWHRLAVGIGFDSLENRLHRIPQESHYQILALAIIASIALCWQQQVTLAPELAHQSPWLNGAQMAALVMGVMPGFRLLLPILILSLYAGSCFYFGPFHMIDYLHCLGIALCLWCWRPGATEESILRGRRLLARFTGLSLCWLGLEKIILPQWSLEVIANRPWLTMGLPEDFFIQAAGLTEFTIGFFIMLGLWVRVSALVLSVLMVFTATIFGEREILGHLPIHAILILLILTPTTDSHHPPVTSVRAFMKAGLYTARYVVVLFGLGAIYYFLALDHYTPVQSLAG